ncbi:hypothetical protein [Cytobacillus dafuensis]|uniref:Glycosyltransferase family 2 protein n=1 Tax=Cytobacillus dafuensis TaxID=1742359 RepID=A0A5B8Z0H1_CYTDA|nr:hypothetical protein [Cytobacillus dafuensis]QED46217.1 hypothetical protein FSZ17_02370 [Cytobacillus dafuensis]
MDEKEEIYLQKDKKKKKKTGSSSLVRKELKRIDKYFKELELNVSEKTNEEKDKKEIAFAISLKSRTLSRDWEQVQANLSYTLKSILRNTDQNFRIIIAGHEKPDIDELHHSHVTWLSVDFPPPPPPGSGPEFTEDKKHKRRVIGAYLRKIGFSGYFMPLDADDWIHYRFVEFIRSQPISNAFLIKKGIMINQSLEEIWLRNRFYIGCGSSALYYFSNEDFPKTSKLEDAERKLFGLSIMNHQKVPQNLANINKDYKTVHYPLVTYVLGHGDNTSVLKGKKSNLVSAKKYKAKGENLKKWVYQYFRVDV